MNFDLGLRVLVPPGMTEERPRGTSLIGKSVRDFFRTKGFTRIFDGFFLKTKGFLPKVYEIFGSEMPLGSALRFYIGLLYHLSDS